MKFTTLRILIGYTSKFKTRKPSFEELKEITNKFPEEYRTKAQKNKFTIELLDTLLALTNIIYPGKGTSHEKNHKTKNTSTH